MTSNETPDVETPEVEGNGPADQHPDDGAELDTADYEADLSGDPVPDTAGEAEIDDDLLEQADTTNPDEDTT